MMGFRNIKRCIKDHQIAMLFFASIFFLVIQQTASGTPAKNSKIVNTINRNYCRNHIFSPRCRGQQKRDVSSHTEEYRMPLIEDIPSVERSKDFTAILYSPTLLGELLRKVIDASPEYDSDSTSYLK